MGRLAEEAAHGSNLVEEMAAAAERMLEQAAEAGTLSRQAKELAEDAPVLLPNRIRLPSKQWLLSTMLKKPSES